MPSRNWARRRVNSFSSSSSRFFAQRLQLVANSTAKAAGGSVPSFGFSRSVLMACLSFDVARRAVEFSFRQRVFRKRPVVTVHSDRPQGHDAIPGDDADIFARQRAGQPTTQPLPGFAYGERFHGATVAVGRRKTTSQTRTDGFPPRAAPWRT